jgi:cobalt/nickel transport protein
MIIPSGSMADQDHRSVDLNLSFSHPFELVGMELVKPEKFFVRVNGKTINLLDSLTSATIMGHTGWKTSHSYGRPGVYQFAMQPEPYWEPAEDCFIVHCTKTVTAAFGAEEGWDEPVGLEAEIIPLTRPFGLYAGNVFQGRVVMNGTPVPGAEVEVEYYNRDGRAQAPSEYMITQVVKADDAGVFTYCAPRAGWWGFAALNTADYRLQAPDGTMKDVEVGGVLWVEFMDWKER